MKKINIKIDGKEISCSPDKTIMEVAKKNNIFIPSLCSHPDFRIKANCRVCVVEIRGCEKLFASCSTKVSEGMDIMTGTSKVRRARNLNIELIFAEHIEKCPECIWNVNCRLLDLAEKYKIEIKRFSDRKKRKKIFKFSNAVEIDSSQCIDCRNCVDACSILQNINYLALKGKGYKQEVVPVKYNKSLFNKSSKKIECIYCGQCTVHCPVGAAQEQSHWEIVEHTIKNKEKFLNNEKKIVVAQFAPSIRVSIGEEFNMPYGKIVTGQIVSGLKKLGFDYVFDVNFGADITTMVEAEELLKRLHGKIDKNKLPMITSCCPAWVKYVEFYHPELIPKLTTSRSPQIQLGGIIKTFWAKKMNINPKNIIVVSVMPCTAKKFESIRPELKIKNMFPVDYVLTTREFAWMLKKNGINFLTLGKSKADNPFGEYSGAAAIYGGSGGVMESALRTAQFLAGKNKKNTKIKLEFQSVRGLKEVKEARVNVAGKELNVAVVSGIGNIEPVIENLDKYNYIEVMACPGGCIGGGGQPAPTTDKIRKKRMEALYKIDSDKKMRKAHENKNVLGILKWLKNEKNCLEHKVLHTSYKKRK